MNNNAVAQEWFRYAEQNLISAEYLQGGVEIQYTQAIRKRMRELVGIAYEREWSLELTEL